MIWILGLYLLNTVLMLIIALQNVRKPALALCWLVISLILPVMGFVIYLLISNPIYLHQDPLTSPNNDRDALPASFNPSASVIAHTLRHFTINGLHKGHAEILKNGLETYARLAESVQKAEKSIYIEFFIYRDDEVGHYFSNLLIERAEAGVHVRFIRDGLGSWRFPQLQIQRMITAGIDCRVMYPLRFSRKMLNLLYRDHCKIVVIDEKEAFTGGINIGLEYTGLKPNIGDWRDTQIRILGEAVNDLLIVFTDHWNHASTERGGHSSAGMKHRREITNQPGTSDFDILMHKRIVNPLVDRNPIYHAYIQTLANHPGIPTPFIREAFFVCITQAAKTIDITTPYFVPNLDLIMAIKIAVARGVRVRLLIPRQADHTIVTLASHTYLGELLEAGVHIFQYNKGILHAKLTVIDSEVSAVGSANYDSTSFRLNFEVCNLLYSADLALELTNQFESDLLNSTLLNDEEVNQRSHLRRIFELGARLLFPFI